MWFLSALVSLPTLLYPPWRIPFKKPSNDKIHLHEHDKMFLNSINGTMELAHHKCEVSTFKTFFQHAVTKVCNNVSVQKEFMYKYNMLKQDFHWHCFKYIPKLSFILIYIHIILSHINDFSTLSFQHAINAKAVKICTLLSWI